MHLRRAMRTALRKLAFAWVCLGLLHCGAASSAFAADHQPLVDKTLVVWAAPATLDQGGGSALTIDNGDGAFDGIVYGELTPRRWMAGSNGFVRTDKNQSAWPAENASPDRFVQMAIVYRGREVAIYRDGKLYSRYTMSQGSQGQGPQAFGVQAVVMFGLRHLETKDYPRSFAGRIRDARIYAKALEPQTIAALAPGKVSADVKPWAWWSFADEGLRERTGRFNQIQLSGDVKLEGGCLVLGGRGATVVMSAVPDALGSHAAVSPVPKVWSSAGAVPDEVVRSTRLLREKLLADPYRPRFHFCTPEDMGMPGDPNGAFFANGRYHLMYLYNRTGSGFCWGHISSADLVHWRHHPDAIGPGGGDEGCFSGGALVDDDGAAYLSYWMLWGARGIGLARSAGGAADRHFDRWTKLEANPVVRSTEWGVTEAKDAAGKTFFFGSADPSNVWKKNGRYYMLTGNLLVLEKLGRKPDAPVEQQGDRLYLLASDNLKHWKYLGVFYQRDSKWTDRSEDNMCPSFLPLPSTPDGGPPSAKHLLLFISHNKGCQYYVGDYRGDRFLPNHHGRMSWVDNTYFAPEALVDAKGRQIMWAWLTDNPPDDKARGWSGVYGLPRTLWLGGDGTLRMRPVPELDALRGHPKSFGGVRLEASGRRTLAGVAGDACELSFQVDPRSAARCGVTVRASRDNAEETLLYYDARARELVFDATRSGVAGRKVVERAPLEATPGRPLSFRVYVDRSIVEVFVDDRQAIGRRVYPSRADSLGVVLFADGGPADFRNVQAWEMTPSNPY